MKAAEAMAGTLNLLSMHLPALWLAMAAGLGAATLTTLDHRPESIEPNACVGRVSEESERPFPLEIGIVERVVDGDTFDVKLERTGRQVRVGLAWMDAPELGQPFGAEATEWAEESLLGRRVVLTVQEVDPQGGLVAQLSVEGKDHLWDVGATLARRGLAWLDPRYGADREALREDQELARSEGLGVWGQGKPIPPRDSRRAGKAGSAAAGAAALRAGAASAYRIG